MKRKATSTLLIVPLMLSLLAIAVPIQSVFATPTLSVSPATTTADVGSFFDVTLDVDGGSGWAVYDIALTYDEAMLEYIGTSAPLPWSIFILDLLPGRVRVVAAVFGGGSVDGPTTLLTHTFRLDLGGRTLLHIASSFLGVLGMGGADHGTLDGEVLSSQASRSDVKIFNAHATRDSIRLGLGETCIDLTAKVWNSGSTTVEALVVTTVVGPADVFGFVSDSVMMGPNDKTDFVTALCPPELNVGDMYLASTALVADGMLVETRHYNHPISVDA